MPQAARFPYGPPPLPFWTVYGPWINLAVTVCLVAGAIYLLFRRGSSSGVWFLQLAACVAVVGWSAQLLRNDLQPPLPFGAASSTVAMGLFWAGIICVIASIALAFRESPESGFASLFFSVFGTLVVVPMLLPAMSTGSPSPITQCRNNLKQIGLALHNFNDERGEPPAAATAGAVPRSWRVEVLPFLDQAPLRSQYVNTEAWDGPANSKIANLDVDVFSCPSNPNAVDSLGRRFTAYAAITGPGTALSDELRPSFPAVPDGNGLTIAVIEACGQNIVWTEPRDVSLSSTSVGINLDGHSPGHSDGLASSRHRHGVNALFVDGSVKTLSPQTDPKVLKALATANGSEPLDDF
ncbi:MAG TPA: DUF1559 domain-containing protein [Caulifigura sp.]|jgi:prepilin-type processing-associated H-X9-DG protein|nr:DUF1559 domain-containing protein [Caulifigura sp.]